MDFVPNQYLDKKHLDEVFNKISYRNAEALYAAIGFGELSATTIANRLTETERREVREPNKKPKLKS